MPHRLDQEIDAFFATDVPNRLGVAVSGGGDSLALLFLLHRFCQAQGIDLHCVTVDHGLRSEGATEARFVADVCAQLQVPHATLTWSGWDGAGNVQQAARDARYRLISRWAMSQDIKQIAVGHTLDDQAETVLQRLARAAGVDGLSAMAPRSLRHGLLWVRPLLRVERDVLRGFLNEIGRTWIDDPSNDDPRFDRIKVRQSWDALQALGITPHVLAQVAENMAYARDALERATQQACRDAVELRGGALRISRDVLNDLAPEIARRLVLASLAWVNGSIYPPRRKSLDAALSALEAEGSATLDGCHVRRLGPYIWVFREFNAVQSERTPVGSIWDGLWLVSGADERNPPDVAPLGEKGLAQLPEWRELGIPREALLSTPAVWRGEELLAAPLIEPHAKWRIARNCQTVSIFDAVFAH